MKRLIAVVQGRVQGVYFRQYTMREAVNLHLTGWVRNEPDGSVRVVAEGPEEILNLLLRFLWHGSPAAQVDQVISDWQPATGEFSGFHVRWL